MDILTCIRGVFLRPGGTWRSIRVAFALHITCLPCTSTNITSRLWGANLSTKWFITWTNTLVQLTLVEVYFKWWCLTEILSKIIMIFAEIWLKIVMMAHCLQICAPLPAWWLRLHQQHADRIFNLKSDAEKWGRVSRAEDNFVWCIILYILQYNTFIHV